jgi:hypothetical protein
VERVDAGLWDGVTVEGRSDEESGRDLRTESEMSS